jgi:hypothetical protein
MYKLKEILNEQKLVELQKAISDMGFRNIRLFKSNIIEEVGPLGIYVEFDPSIIDRYDSRCLALMYKASEIVGCQTLVVSNKDVRADFVRENSVDLDSIFNISELQDVPVTNIHELEVKSKDESSYKRSMLSYKAIYDQLYSLKHLSQTKDNAGELKKQSNVEKRTFDKLLPGVESFIMNSTPEEFSDFQRTIQAIYDKHAVKRKATPKA